MTIMSSFCFIFICFLMVFYGVCTVFGWGFVNSAVMPDFDFISIFCSKDKWAYVPGSLFQFCQIVIDRLAGHFKYQSC